MLPTHYPKADKGRLIVWGLLAAAPFGGMTWQVIHYLVGFRRLGFEVWYVEDVSWRNLLDPVDLCPTLEYEVNIRFLQQQLQRIGLEDHWVLRPPREYEKCLGALEDVDQLNELYKSADAVFNLCFCQEDREGHENISCRVLIETDPVMNQVKVAKEDSRTLREYDKFHFHFTYGENLGAPDCPVPMTRYNWLKTRPPVCVDWWDTKGQMPRQKKLTTITNWNHSGHDVEWEGQSWKWNKYEEFQKFIALPQRAPLELEMAMGGLSKAEDIRQIETNGWKTLPASTLNNPSVYAYYIRQSMGEFSIAKGQYVLPHSGWFSDRSVCYLAAGRPVITQSTGFEKRIPTGEGLFAFRECEEALNAIACLKSNYAHHMAKAREIAHEYFGTEKVLGDMLKAMGLM